ncbi:MAG: hypothetical protein A3J29_06260 [Acidobacteria bacterium RIFCSPLOWO2_12_FULL_67_14b]|nr:MAG: hypothetical protein A3J29_06260 [Acidobacteria bacterium RIFCSPLOWO2_12_FULL_67_14b]
MATYTIAPRNLDGTGSRPTRVYALPPVYVGRDGVRAPAPPAQHATDDDETYLRAGENIPAYRARMAALTPPSTRQAMRPTVYLDYWSAVTDVPCPADACTGTIRWAEAGYVPGYRICDGCGRHYQADGTAAAPVLLRVGSRRSRVQRRA